MILLCRNPLTQNRHSLSLIGSHIVSAVPSYMADRNDGTDSPADTSRGYPRMTNHAEVKEE